MENLKVLVAKHGQAEVARLGDTDPAYLSQILIGTKDRFGKPRRIGPTLARKIEAGFDLPRGSFDRPPEDSMPAMPDQESRSTAQPRLSPDELRAKIARIGVSSQAPEKIEPASRAIVLSAKRQAPVVGTAQMGDDGFWLEFGHPVGHGDGFLEVISDDPNTYAVRLRGFSEIIDEGYYAAVEPNHPPQQGEYVLVKLLDGRYMMKKLVLQGKEELILTSKALGEMRFKNSQVEFVHAVTNFLPPSKWKL